MSQPVIEVTIDDAGWLESVPDLVPIAEQAAALALSGAGLTPKGYEIALLATSDDRMKTLNHAFRGKDAPTNVLSWPAEELGPATPGEPPRPPALPAADRHTPLGDVAIGLHRCRSEADVASIPLKNHVMHLILHGCLHLLGYDHENEADADRMEGIERTALASVGIPDPYV